MTDHIPFATLTGAFKRLIYLLLYLFLLPLDPFSFLSTVYAKIIN